MRYVIPAVLGAAILFAVVFCLNALRLAFRVLRSGSPDELAERLRAEEDHVPLEQIADVFLRVLVCAEDPRFTEHRGFDIYGIRTAVILNIREHRSKEHMRGGSTITQQLVKNVYLTPEKTFTRKLTELFLSVHLEKKLSKKDILELYCNAIYYGRGCLGIAAAAEVFFGCLPSELSLNRSLTLVCKLPNPDRYDPEISPELFEKAREYTMQQLLDHSIVSTDTCDMLKRADWKDEAPQAAAEKGTWN